MEEKKINIVRLLLAGLLGALIGILTFSSKWIGIDVGFAGISGTLLQIGDLFGTIDRYIDADAAHLIVPVVYGLLAFAAVMLISHFFFIFKSYRDNEDCLFEGCFVYTAVLSALVIVSTWILNRSLSSKTGGWLNNVIALEFAPYLVLLLSVAGVLVCRKMPIMVVSAKNSSVPEAVKNLGFLAGTTMQSMTDKVNTTLETVKKRAEEKQRHCPSCGQLCTDADAVFCEKCGAELAPVRLCASCGKELRPDAKFCPYCGTAVREENKAEAAEIAGTKENTGV